MPKAKTLDHGAKVPGTDGQKMSKSYDNTLAAIRRWKKIRKQIMRITTDSRPMEDPKEPEDDHLFQLYRLFASRPATSSEWRRCIVAVALVMAKSKKRLPKRAKPTLHEARQRREDLERNLDYRPRDARDGARSGSRGRRQCACPRPARLWVTIVR